MAPCWRNLNTQGVYFLQLRSDSGQEKEPRSPQRALCSPLKECLKPAAPAYTKTSTHKHPETHDGEFFGGIGETHLNVFIFTVDVVKRRRETFLRVPQCLCELYCFYPVHDFTGRQRRPGPSWTSWSSWLPRPER